MEEPNSKTWQLNNNAVLQAGVVDYETRVAKKAVEDLANHVAETMINDKLLQDELCEIYIGALNEKAKGHINLEFHHCPRKMMELVAEITSKSAHDDKYNETTDAVSWLFQSTQYDFEVYIYKNGNYESLTLQITDDSMVMWVLDALGLNATLANPRKYLLGIANENVEKLEDRMEEIDKLRQRNFERIEAISRIDDPEEIGMGGNSD